METGGVGKKWRTKSAISETRKDRGNVTMEGLQEVTAALSSGTIPEPVCPLFLKIGVIKIVIISGKVVLQIWPEQ